MNILQHKIYIAYLIVAISVLPTSLLAQHVGGNLGPCPGGSAPVNGSCGSPSNASSGGYKSRPEIWRDRYGAIAFSKTGTVIGTAKDQHSKRAARRLAMKKCVGPDCRIVEEYVNACGSIAWGPQNDGVTGFGIDQDSFAAEDEAIKNCLKGGGGVCQITTTTCSLPVRVQ